jgi:hypothetical protein
MMVDQSLTPVASDRGEILSRFEWLSAEEINEAPSGKPDDHAETVPGSLIAPPAFPAWPRVYPGL